MLILTVVFGHNIIWLLAKLFPVDLMLTLKYPYDNMRIFGCFPNFNVGKVLHLKPCVPHLHGCIALFCSINHVVVVIMQAQEDDKNGFLDSARARAKISLGLNITAVVLVVLTWLLIIIGFIVGFILNVAIATNRAV